MMDQNLDNPQVYVIGENVDDQTDKGLETEVHLIL